DRRLRLANAAAPAGGDGPGAVRGPRGGRSDGHPHAGRSEGRAMKCPRCGALVRPGQPCPACAPLASIEGKIKRRRFISNPMGRWTTFGWWAGMALGAISGVVLAVVVGLRSPGPDPVGAGLTMVAGGALAGAVLGSALAVLYKSLVRPVIL